MRNLTTKILTALLAVILCFSFGGCYDENKTWAAQKGEEKLPIGAYIYYLYSSYSEARAKVGSETDVLSATIEDKPAETWLRDDAMSKMKSYFWVNDKFNELGLSLTEEELKTAANNTSTMWDYYKTTLEELGIAKTSFDVAYTQYRTKYEKVFGALYDAGGEFAIDENELKTYFTENYCNYEYFYAPLTKNDESGNSVAMTDEEKAMLKETLEDYVSQINSGKLTTTDAAQRYAAESVSDSTYTANVSKKTAMILSLQNAAAELGDNKAAFVDGTSYYYVLTKLPIADKFAEQTSDVTNKLTLMFDYKGTEFADYAKEQSAGVEGITVNDSAVNSIKTSRFVTEDTKTGTSSTASEASSSSASSETASAPASSETSSASASSAVSKVSSAASSVVSK